MKFLSLNGLLNGAPTFLGQFGAYFVLSYFYCWLAFVIGENLCVAEELRSNCLECQGGMLLPLALPAEINCSQLENGGLKIRLCFFFYSSTQMELSNKN